MAKLRKGVAYRRLERPYTRVSRFRKNTFIRMNPQTKIVRFGMGDVKKSYSHAIDLIANSSLQIRDNAIESARQSSNRLLEKTIGHDTYYYKIRIYPHHILRENPLAAGAGADRFSTGMSHSFGKPIGIASRVKKGQKLFTVFVNKQHLDIARQALKMAAAKLPCSCTIRINQNQQIDTGISTTKI